MRPPAASTKSDIQDQQEKISKYRDQSLKVKTNQEYRALMDEIKFAEQKVAASEDKILEIMVAADTRKEGLKRTEAELKADTAENEKEKESARLRTAEDEKELAALTEQRNELRASVTEDVLRHYDRVLKFRGSALSAVHEDQMCSACRVMIRPQPFQEVMTNEQFVTCDSCSRIMLCYLRRRNLMKSQSARKPLQQRQKNQKSLSLPKATRSPSRIFL